MRAALHDLLQEHGKSPVHDPDTRAQLAGHPGIAAFTICRDLADDFRDHPLILDSADMAAMFSSQQVLLAAHNLLVDGHPAAAEQLEGLVNSVTDLISEFHLHFDRCAHCGNDLKVQFVMVEGQPVCYPGAEDPNSCHARVMRGEPLGSGKTS